MKKITIILLLTLSLTSCSQKVECNGTDEKKLLIKNLQQALLTKNEDLKQVINSKSNLDLKTEEVDSLIVEFLEFLEFSNVRTLKVDKDLNLCHCNTGLKLKDYDIFIENFIEKGNFDLNNQKVKKNIELIKNVFEEEIKVDYSAQFTEDKKLFIETNKNSFVKNMTVYKLLRTYVDMKEFNNKYSNNSTTSPSTINKSANDSEEWINRIFKSENKSNKFYFPVEKNVCSSRFMEFMSESEEVFGASNLDVSERAKAEKEYLKKWKNIYPSNEDANWLFGRGNGLMGDGTDILKDVKIKKITNLEYNIDVDFGDYKTTNLVKLIPNSQSFLIDYVRTTYLE